MGHAHATPASGDGEKDFGGFGDERLLLVGGEHQVAVALLHVGERGEDFSADAEIDTPHVGAFFGAFQAQRDFAEIGGGHEPQSIACV